VIVKKGDLISREQAREINELAPATFRVRSPISCQAVAGICQKCFGNDLSTNKIVEIGAAVGIVTAQAIGEPGTQLTMRTFHTGGVASVGDITQGLPRVAELFEVRSPKGKALIAEHDGKVESVESKGGAKLITLSFEDEKGKTQKLEYSVPLGITVLVSPGDLVGKGTQLTEGSLDLKELYSVTGSEEAISRYIIKEIETIYRNQGVGINEKYVEVIIRQMLSRVRVKESGDTTLLPGAIIEKGTLRDANRNLSKKQKPATYHQLLLGITKVALTTDSFLAAASFQEVVKSLGNAAVMGKEDRLRGLKENVIIGRLIPAGIGMFREVPESDEVVSV
jgi:DNA-directed RNA polymerase subunit beta'